MFVVNIIAETTVYPRLEEKIMFGTVFNQSKTKTSLLLSLFPLLPHKYKKSLARKYQHREQKADLFI